MYNFKSHPYLLLTANAVNPISMREPVVIFNNFFDHRVSQVSDVVGSLKSQVSNLPYSSTYASQGGISSTPEVRNSKSADIGLIPEYVSQSIYEAACLAWKRYTYTHYRPIPGGKQFLVYDKGHFRPHFDQGIYLHGRIWYNNPERQMTVLAYLNDDYEGGELRFNNILDEAGNPLVYKPKAGDIIAFPGNPQYTHEVLPVKSGIRVVATQWFDDIDYFQDLGTLDVRAIAAIRPLLESGFTYGHRSLRAEEFDASRDNYYWIKRFSDLDENTKTLRVEHQLQTNYPELMSIWNTFKNSQFAPMHKLTRVYANLHTYGVEGTSHTDSSKRNSYTTLIYAVDEWNPQWLGATVFFDPENPSRITRAINPEPWKVIQFRGSIKHCATAVHKSCKAARITFMFKSLDCKEVHPNERAPELG